MNRIAPHYTAPSITLRASAALASLAFAAVSPFAARAQDTPPPPPIVAPPVSTTPALAPVASPALAPPQMAYVAAPKLGKDGQIDAHFQQRHDSFLKRGKSGPIGVLFLGDSITEGWNKAKDVWQAHYGADNPANFGIGGDRTQHVLWRIDRGELDGIAPKVVVLMIGTNNLGNSREAGIIRADTEIVAEIHQKLPDTKVLLLGIFPRGANPNDAKVVKLREEIKAINTALAKLDDGGKTRYLDIGDKFLDPTGAITKEIMADALHPTPAGYAIWADAMQPTLDAMMK